MKICGIVCEYNPFHNGHAYLISRAKETSGCDAVVCVMSGSFVQRGEPAILDRFTRAEHAVRSGADAVFELPSAFALSPAELFASGAVAILCALPGFSSLAFGCEGGAEEDFRAAAKALSEETEEFRQALKETLKTGASLARARADALRKTGQGQTAALLSSPNNILGAEYCRALRERKADAAIYSIKRVGSGYKSAEMAGNFSSSTAIRAALRKDLCSASSNVPSHVFEALRTAPDLSSYKKIALYALLAAGSEKLNDLPDCVEGLNNRLFSLARTCTGYDDLIEKATNKRYTSSRIRRILSAAVLGITKKDAALAKEDAPYLRLLALKRDRADELLAAFSRSVSPLLVRASDRAGRGHGADALLALDERAADIRDLLSGKHEERRPRFV